MLLDEYQLKAAFLYNVMKFVQWPSDSSGDPKAPLVFCVVGEDPFRGNLDRAVAGRSIQGHALSISRFGGASQPSELKACSMLFISTSARGRVAELRDGLVDAPVLTVAEWEGFSASGGILELTIIDNKLAFSVNQKAAESRRLKISSQLLKLAREVRR
jgi:hypothetical protein